MTKSRALRKRQNPCPPGPTTNRAQHRWASEQEQDSDYSYHDISYVYDELNRLIRADNLEKNCTEVYNYNNGGNITSVVTYPHTWGSLSGLTPTKTVYYTYGDSNWKDKLTSYNGQSITYDAIGNPSGVRYYNGSSTADYYFVCNWHGDVIRIFDSTGADVAEYFYDAWGNVVSVRSPSGAEITSSTHIANVNPLRYRGYYYDTETKLYYLQSRYYDPETCRFINADGFVSTGQGVSNHNMFIYCGNNPINRIDSTGQFWEKVGKFLGNTWGHIKSWAKNTFGFGRTTTATLASSEIIYIPDPIPITAKTDSRTSKTLSSYGDSSKPISFYANMNTMSPIKSSSAGINFNISKLKFDISIGLDNMGISASFSEGNTTNSMGLKLNLSELKVGVEFSTTIQWDTNMSETTYTNASLNGWMLAFMYTYATTGQPVHQPSPLPSH